MEPIQPICWYHQSVSLSLEDSVIIIFLSLVARAGELALRLAKVVAPHSGGKMEGGESYSNDAC